MARGGRNPVNLTLAQKMSAPAFRVGEHHFVELNDCNRDVINSEARLRAGMLAAVAASGATIIKDVFHSFSPHGVTGVIVIAESHVSVHTWPEYGYAAVDIFTCGEKMNVSVLIEALRQLTGATKTVQNKFDRGPYQTSDITLGDRRAGY